MKKFLSVICCLFLSISCFTPFALARQPGNNEIIHLTPKCAWYLQITLPCSIRYWTTPDDRVFWNWGYYVHVEGKPGDRGRWRAHRQSDGSYILNNYRCSNPYGWGSLHLNNTLVLDDACKVDGGGANIVWGWKWHGGDNQRWVFEDDSHNPGYVRIRNKASGKYLTIHRPSSSLPNPTVVGWRWYEYGHPDLDCQLWQVH